MYGLLNRAVRDLTRSRFGETTWANVRARAGVQDDAFQAMEQYPDALTYELVGALCEETGLEVEQALEAFGEYWINFTGAEGYGQLLDASGDTLPEFLNNLDDLHTRVALTFRELAPPTFTVENQTADSLTLHYYSHREGLGAVMVGLLKGLGARFEVRLTVKREVLARTEDGHTHEAFEVSW
ncbi:MAG: heme NO-binding domain-containing protein [Longimicrobiales bacterium]